MKTESAFRHGHLISQHPLIEYGKLKELLEAAPDGKKFLETLRSNVHDISRSFNEQTSVIIRKQELHFAPLLYGDIAILSSLNKPELRVLKASLNEVYFDLQRLVCYSQTNAHALVRLGRKAAFVKVDALDANIQQVDFVAPNEVLNMLQKVSGWLFALEQMSTEPEPLTTSLLGLSASLRDLLRQKDARIVEKDIEKETAATLVSMLRYSICCANESCYTMLLDSACREPAAVKELSQQLLSCLCTAKQACTHETATILARMMVSTLEHFVAADSDVLHREDALGRVLLHYAVEFGSLEAIQYCMTASRSHPRASNSLDRIIAHADSRRETPLDLAIIKGEPRILNALLRPLVTNPKEVNSPLLDTSLESAQRFALKSGNVGLFNTVLSVSSLRSRNITCEKAILRLATELGLTGAVESIMNTPHFDKALLNEHEGLRRRPPLLLACIEGYMEIVVLLVEGGADVNFSDAKGWTAIEHAAYRGHLRILEYLEPRTSGFARNSLRLGPLQKGYPSAPRLRVGSHEGVVILKLGSSNLRKPAKAFECAQSLSSPTCVSADGTGFEICVELLDDIMDQQKIASLPIVEADVMSPWIFQSKNLESATIRFTLRRPNQPAIALCTAMADLKALRTGLFTQHESLVRDHSVPMIDLTSRKRCGTVTFTFLIIRPYAPQYLVQERHNGFWKGQGQGGKTAVVGHRGFGANKSKQRYLQIGENTIQGFKSASTLGASCVEFDVQLTKDVVPVIYHDFLIKDTGTETPIHTLTKDQFLHIGKQQDFSSDIPAVAERRFVTNPKSMPHQTMRPRSRSDEAYDNTRMQEMISRLRVTSYGPTKAVKGNRRGVAIQEPLVTLEQMLAQLPEAIDFDLEIKYPMLWEAENQGFEPWAFELNFFIDKILDMIFQLCGKRNITFSSFSPEVCIALALKQKDFPTLFITKAGNVPVGDIRCSSIQQAVHFAREWGLAGIVTVIKPIQYCPRIINYVKQFGLVYGTYGTTSDDPETVKMLSDAGLDAIVTNRVKLISDTLKEHYERNDGT